MEKHNLVYTFIIIISCLSLYLCGRAVIRFFGKRKGLKVRRQEILSNFLLFMSLALSTLILIVLWGFNMKSIWLFITSFIGLFGIALFASWSLLSNIVSAFILFFTVPFHIGDTIEIRDNEALLVGLIEDLTLFYIFLRAEGNKIVIIPNNVALQKIIIRHSRKKSS